MTARPSYSSPVAFRRALTDKLKERERASRWTLPQLQRQIGYDRLLERLYLLDQEWIVKGATALLARDIGVRGTLDVDVFRAKAREVAEAELRGAAANDIGDWFRFELGAPTVTTGENAGVRIPVVAYVGTSVWTTFRVDLVGADLRMTGEPEDVPPLARIAIPDVEQHGYRAYPLVDHVADKVVATFQRYGEKQVPSTRYRDLIDLVAIVTSASVEAKPQTEALTSEARRRAVALPARFAVPDRDLWERGYAAEARRSLLPAARTLEEAVAVVRPFIDPILTRSAGGTWDPHRQGWVR